MKVRRLSVSWRRFVGGTVEWKVLSMLWSPEQGYNGHILRNWVKGVKPDRRLSWELTCYRVIKAENRSKMSKLSESESRVWYIKERCAGPYIFSRWQNGPPGLIWQVLPTTFEARWLPSRPQLRPCTWTQSTRVPLLVACVNSRCVS